MNRKQNQVILKITICLILMGFAYRFCFSSFLQISPVFLVVDDADHDHNSPSPPPAVANFTLSDQLPVNDTRTHDVNDFELPAQFPVNDSGSHDVSTKCDIFTGEWVENPSGPWYTGESCDTIEIHQNCHKNGRPDSGYIHWRWKPRDCDLPKFDPKWFLHLMRNKSMAFIGDSISRNHVQSLLCILSQVEKAVEVYHDEGYRSKRWFFRAHEFTLSVIWSPFLTKAEIFEDNDGHASDAVRLHLDELDPVWTDQFNNFDYIEIAGGKWFLKTAIYYEQNAIVGCHNCKKENISELGFYYAYRKAIRITLDFITRSNRKVYAFLRTTTPDHFENGEWNTGGYCNRTVPFNENEVELRDIDIVMRDIELEEFEKAVNGSRNGSVLKLFDTTRLSLLRPDGHPGPYRVFRPFDGKDLSEKVQNDCLHWCLPGPIDSWNDLMMHILLRG